jgi:glycosyltransferase involved in cell wall biosynthesis
MSDFPRISVITPSYNQGEYIENTIRSVLNQNYPALEYIVIDGGSSDRTVEILKKYEERIKWVSESDRGQAHAINKGLRRVTGDVIAYLNSDDSYEPGALHAVGEFFSTHPGASWLTGKCRIVDAQGAEIRKLVTRYKNFWLCLKSYRVLLVLDYVSQPATFWRRGVFEKIGGFDETLHYTMDYDFSLRVGREFNLWTLDRYLASFRIHPNSKGTTATKEHFDSDLEVARRYTSSPFFRQLHKLHNLIIVSIYRLMNTELI